VVGERPGQDEDKEGIPFIGKSGQELNKVYIPASGLCREQCLVTNAVQCAHETNETPADEQIRVCSQHHLPQLIEQCKPELIVLVGGSAHKLLSSEKLPLDTVHGFPRQLGFPHRQWYVSTYHPARALRDTKYMAHILNDWRNIGRFLNGDYTPPTPPFPSIDTSLITSTNQIDNIFKLAPILYRGTQVCGIDTESHLGPFSLQFSPSYGVGGMILFDRPDLISYFARTYLHRYLVVLHNDTHDLVELRQLGVTVPAWIDTMKLSYHLCDQPQKLKALSWRLFGVNMRSWEDVVLPASTDALLEWLAEAHHIAEKDLGSTSYVLYKRPYRGNLGKTVTTPSGSLSIFNRIAKHTQENDEYDPWKRMDDYKLNNPEDYTHIEARLGSYPTLGIRNANINDAVVYGCSDAIYTAALPEALYKLRFNSEGLDRFRIAEGDGDRL